jgi:probable HAF family extracellular repeat protein
MVDLGTLGGASSVAAAISGTTAVGTSSVAGDTATHAVAWDLSTQPAAIRDLGTLGGASSTAIGVSGSLVIGTSWISGDTEQHAFAYDLNATSPSMLDLGTLGGIMSSPTGVSGSRVVGYSTNGASIPHAFVYDISAVSPVMIDLGSSPADPSAAIAVSGTVATGYQNDAGGTQHAVAWDLGVTPPTLRDLGSVGAGDSTGRAVSGSIVVGNSAGHAFAYDLAAGSPSMVDLGTLGGANSFATGVSSSIVAGRADLSSGAQHAVVWDLSAQPPADANADGVVDALQPAGTAAGAFVDGSLSPNTVGSIVNAGGLLVTVADAVSATDGVQISVGTGSGSATFAVCGGFNLSIAAGSTVVVTCGSVRVNTLSGTAYVLLGNGTTVAIVAGGVGKVSSNAGTFSVSNLGTTPGVTVTTNGVVLPVPPGTATAVDQTPPAILVTGATSYTVDQTVTLTCSATDASGIKATNCPRLVSGPAQSFPLGATTVTATATDNAGNSATRAATFTVRVTPTSLCQLTKQMLQSSSRYLSLKPAQRPAADARAILACQPVLAISPTTPAKSKAALVSAYKVAVRALLGDWLTPAQIQKLTTYADAL